MMVEVIFMRPTPSLTLCLKGAGTGCANRIYLESPLPACGVRAREGGVGNQRYDSHA